MPGAESELGSTDDVRALVLGDPDALGGTATHLRTLSDAFGRTAAGLAHTDVGSWRGEAADAFRSRFGGAPERWATAAEAFERAATAWEAYARAVGWAQARAAEAAALYRSGVAASEQARLEASGPSFADPGVAAVERAREILAEARRQRDALAAEAARVVAAAAARAPDPPSGWDRVGAEAADSIDALGTEGEHFLGGLADGAATLVGSARAVNPVDPYNATQPARYVDALSTAAAGAVTAAVHPVRMISGFVGTGWGSDPARAAGALVPSLVAAFAAGGAGRAVPGAAERAAPFAPPVPHGFAGVEDFGRFGAHLHDGLARAGYPDTRAAVQGSAVTGHSFRTGADFDAGRTSDYDVALGGQGIFDAAVEARIALRSAGSRTGPLIDSDLDRLGLGAVQRELSELAGREVNLMIYRDIEDALGRSPSMGVPGP